MNKPFNYLDYIKQVHITNRQVVNEPDMLIHKFPITFEQFLNWKEFSDFNYSLDFDETGENYGHVKLPESLSLSQLESQFVYEFVDVGLTIAIEFDLVDFSVHSNAVFVKHDIHVCRLITGSVAEYVCDEISIDIEPNYIVNMTPIQTDLTIEDKPVFVVLNPECDFDSLPTTLQTELTNFAAN